MESLTLIRRLLNHTMCVTRLFSLKMLLVRLASSLLILVVVDCRVYSEFDRNFKIEAFKSYLRAFISKKSSLNIIQDVKEFNEAFVSDLVDGLAQESPAILTLHVCDIRNNVNLLIADSPHSFEKVFNSSKCNKKATKIIVLVGDQTFDVTDIFHRLREKNVIDVYVMFEKDKNISLATYQPITANNCFDSTLIILRTFNDMKLMQQRKSTIKDFHGCPLKVGLIHNPPYVIFRNINTSFEEMNGRDVEILRVLSKILNFRVNHEKFANDAFNVAFSMIKENQIDVVVGDLFLNKDRLQHIDNSVPYFTSNMGLIIPGGRPFNALERLLRPFHIEVWFLIAVTASAALACIAVVKFSSRTLRKFVLGVEMPHLGLNFVAIVLGVSLNRLPTTNFARFFITSFAVSCLVLRSAYQGSVFRFMQSDLKHKVVESIDEMVEEGFTFYTLLGAESPFVDEKFKPSMVKAFPLKGLEDVMEKLKDPTFKGARSKSQTPVMYMNQIRQYDFVFEICKQTLLSSPVVMYLSKDSLATKPFNEKLGQLMNGGFIQHWHKALLYKKQKEPNAQPKVLTLQHLIGIFHICWLGCLIATFVFIVELLTPRK